MMSDENEVVPDSEEERQRMKAMGLLTNSTHTNGVIEISSDEEDSNDVDTDYEITSPTKNGARFRIMRRIKDSSESESEQHTPRSSQPKGVSSTPQPHSFNPRCQLLGPVPGPSRSSEQDIIDLTISSDSESDSNPFRLHGKGKETPSYALHPESAVSASASTTPSGSGLSLEKIKSLVNPTELNEYWDADDGAILVLDEPRSARKPISTRGKGRVPAARNDTLLKQIHLSRVTVPPQSDQISSSRMNPNDSDDEEVLTLCSGTNTTDSNSVTPRSKRTNSSVRSSGSRTKNSPRVSKKAAQAAEKQRRELYAKQLFEELNKAVFDRGLPKETELKWSNRLLTTAGKASWHKSREGIHTTKIELATKILDCDERIRNTLSHEMCHLACWIIDENPKENHGRLFKSWASRVMRKRPEIEVTTRHSYEITYQYEWKCSQCSLIYGRHSKSIRPDECVCGSCKVGKLIPLFATRTPTFKANSSLASSTTRESPRLITTTPDTATVELPPNVNVHPNTPALRGQTYLSGNDDSDPEILDIIRAVRNVDIAS